MARLHRLALAAILTLVAPLLAMNVSRAENRDIVVFAAASMKNALDEVSARYEAQTSKNVVISYAASSTLAKQILAGAPAQVFISADQDWMSFVEQNGAILPGSRRELLGNSLVLIAPKESTAQISIGPGFDLRSQLGDGRLAVAETTAVPAGRYAKAALTHFGVWTSLEDRLAQAVNVRAALALVARGEAPFGIVYATDAAAEPAVRVIATFPADAHPAIVYPAALTKDVIGEDAADFLAFASSTTAAAIFARHGFKSRICANDCRNTN